MPEVIPEGPTKCQLYLDNPRRVVGTGIVEGTQCEVIHGVPFAHGCVRVLLERAHPSEVDTPLPYPVDDAVTIGTAAGYYLQWPRYLIEFATESRMPPPSKGKKKVVRHDQGLRQKRRERPLDSTGPMQGVRSAHSSTTDVTVLVLLKNLIDNPLLSHIEVPMNAHFNRTDWTDLLGRENIMEILKDDWLSASCWESTLRNVLHDVKVQRFC